MPDTGAARWFYQYNPHDLYDYDGVNENVLMDLDIGGSTRKVLAHPDRNGYLYVIDRATGEVLSANPFVHVNTIDRRGPEDRTSAQRPGEKADRRPGGSQHLPARRGRQGLAALRLLAHDTIFSISRIRTSARTRRQCRRTTSLARHMSAQT